MDADTKAAAESFANSLFTLPIEYYPLFEVIDKVFEETAAVKKVFITDILDSIKCQEELVAATERYNNKILEQIAEHDEINYQMLKTNREAAEEVREKEKEIAALEEQLANLKEKEKSRPTKLSKENKKKYKDEKCVLDFLKSSIDIHWDYSAAPTLCKGYVVNTASTAVKTFCLERDFDGKYKNELWKLLYENASDGTPEMTMKHTLKQ